MLYLCFKHLSITTSSSWAMLMCQPYLVLVYWTSILSDHTHKAKHNKIMIRNHPCIYISYVYKTSWSVADLTMKLRGVNFFVKKIKRGHKKIKGGQFQFYNLKICIILTNKKIKGGQLPPLAPSKIRLWFWFLVGDWLIFRFMWWLTTW